MMTNPQHRTDRDITAATAADTQSATAQSDDISHRMQETMNRLGQNEQFHSGVHGALGETQRTIIGNLDSGSSESSGELAASGLQDMLDSLKLQETMDRQSHGEETTAAAQKVAQNVSDAVIGKLADEESEPSAVTGAQSVQLHDLPMFEPIQDVGLNPQPEPPSPPVDITLPEVAIREPIAEVGLNPQPEPPSTSDESPLLDITFVQPIDDVGLNPQPEPPSEPDYASVQDISIGEPTDISDISEQAFIDPSL